MPSKPHISLEALKSQLLDACDPFPLKMVRAAVDQKPSQLMSCIQARGGNFENENIFSIQY